MDNLDIKNFQPYSSVEDNDNVLLVKMNGTDGRISVALLRSQLGSDVRPSIKDGVWHIGAINTNVQAEAEIPVFRTSSQGIEYKYEKETDDAWRPLVGYDVLKLKFTDLSEEQVRSLIPKLSDFTVEEIEELQRPAAEATQKAIDAADIADTSRKNIEENEGFRKVAEVSRSASEEERAIKEEERIATENSRKLAETDRSTSELARREEEEARVSAENTREANEDSREIAEVGRVNAETTRETSEQGRKDAEALRVLAEDDRVQEFATLKEESETATENATSVANHRPT